MSKQRNAKAADTGGIHSNAFNFLSSVSTGVDPRTGMYSCSISLPSVATNSLCGPAMGLSLSFSSLNPVDAGFGIGWSLTTTRYDARRKILSLSTGESFRVDTLDGTATFKDRKLRSFDMIEEDDGYRIVHKSGMSELIRSDPGSDRAAIVREIRSPEGHVVILEQQSGNGVTRLMSVADGTGVLLSVSYGSGRTTVRLHAGTTDAAEFVFRKANGHLVGVDLPPGYGDGWLFGYEIADTGLLLLKTTTMPTGGREEVVYELEGHLLPGGTGRPLTHMPRVKTFRRDPGHGQAVVETRYTYSERNFFGYGALDDWSDDEDNLYRVVLPASNPYVYSSTETIMDGRSAVKTVQRTFNRFHLLIREVTTQAGCVTEAITVFEENPSSPFEAQVPWCQLPIETRTRVYREDEPGRFREDIETSMYDDHGNRLSHIDALGVEERTSYYPVEGMEGSCPRDPLGFVRSPMEMRVSPPTGTEGPTRLTRYRYELLRSALAEGPDHVVPRSKALYAGEREGPWTLLIDETQAFVDDGGVHHGRPLGTLRVVGGIASTTAMTYVIRQAERNARGEAMPVLVTTTTRIAGDGQQDRTETTVRMRALMDGRPVVEVDARQVSTRRAYDALGRLVMETASADSDFAVSVTKQYTLAHTDSWVDTTDTVGQRTRTRLDGFGREVRQVALDWKGDGRDHETWRAFFDVLGQMVSETHTDNDVPIADWKVGSPRLSALVLTTSYAYDGWGQRVETQHPTGVRSLARVDPISLVTDEYDEVIAEGTVSRSGHVRTTYSRSGKPLQVQRIDSHGVQLDRRYNYDGLDRCVAETDAGENMTRYAYDAHDRLVQTVLPDATVIVRTYARHSELAWLENIVVRHPSLGGKGVDLGRQAFDGLGRLTSCRAGQRETRYAYEAGSVVPSEIYSPSGEVLACTYEKYLSDCLTGLSSRGKLPSEHLVFVHDKMHGGLLHASNSLGTQDMEYLPSGRLARATFVYDGHARVAECSDYTLKGELTRFTSVDGEERRLSFDAMGRLRRLQTDTLLTELTYDAFGRLGGMTTATAEGSLSSSMRIEYDERGRESRRVIESASATALHKQVLTSSYNVRDDLETRTLVTEEGVREERYEYDARGRLVTYMCEGVGGPLDPSGHVIARQWFTFDALDNVRKLVTRYASDLELEKHAVFSYAKDDPTQLIHITERQEARPDVVLTFSYDASGNLLQDEAGRQLEYDAIGRLTGWTHGSQRRAYRYDAMDRIACVTDNDTPRYRYYEDGQVVSEAGSTSSSYHVVDGHVIAQTTLGEAIRRVLLLGIDAQGSVIDETSDAVRQPVYTAYGDRGDDSGGSDVAYAGELRDRDTGWYLLGSYRAYNPRLMRFQSPDAFSPFGKGGLNAYAYGSGDPVNHVDPTGEALLDVLSLVATVVSAAVTIGLMIWTWGAIAPAMGATWGALTTWSSAGLLGEQVATTASTIAGFVGVGVDVASAVTTLAGDEQTGGYLAIAGVLTGSVAGVLGAGPKAAPAVADAVSKGVRGVRGAFSENAVMKYVVDIWPRGASPSVRSSMSPSPTLRRASSLPGLGSTPGTPQATRSQSAAGNFVTQGTGATASGASSGLPTSLGDGPIVTTRGAVSAYAQKNIRGWVDRARSRLDAPQSGKVLRRVPSVEESTV